MPKRAAVLLGALLAAGPSTGCVYVRYQTQTPRSATEQLLVSRSIERAVEGLELPDVYGKLVSVELASIPGDDAKYLLAELEARLARAGAQVVAVDQAELRVVALVGVIGTAGRSTSWGIPSLPTPFGVTPELPFIKVVKQRGYTRVRVVARDSGGAGVAESEPSLGRASFEVTNYLFVVRSKNEIYPGEENRWGID